MEYNTFKNLINTVLDRDIQDKENNPENKFIVNSLIKEYPHCAESIKFFCFSNEDKTVFFIDGVEYDDTIENLWKECEGILTYE